MYYSANRRILERGKRNQIQLYNSNMQTIKLTYKKIYTILQGISFRPFYVVDRSRKGKFILGYIDLEGVFVKLLIFTKEAINDNDNKDLFKDLLKLRTNHNLYGFKPLFEIMQKYNVKRVM